jgi:hypothetical protein
VAPAPQDLQIYSVNLLRLLRRRAACEAAAAPEGGVVIGSARNLATICGISGEVP